MSTSDMNERLPKGESSLYVQFGEVPIRVPQLAPQFQVLPQSESVSSIPRYVRWVPPQVPNVASTHPSSMLFGEDHDCLLYHEVLRERLNGK